MTDDPGKMGRPLSDQLMEAAARVHELPPSDLSRLLMKAAIRLRAVQQTGANLEHIPVHAYHLLRELSHKPIALGRAMGQADESAVDFLLSRDLASKSPDGKLLIATPAGLEIGEIADERQRVGPE